MTWLQSRQRAPFNAHAAGTRKLYPGRLPQPYLLSQGGSSRPATKQGPRGTRSYGSLTLLIAIILSLAACFAVAANSNALASSLLKSGARTSNLPLYLVVANCAQVTQSTAGNRPQIH